MYIKVFIRVLFICNLIASLILIYTVVGTFSIINRGELKIDLTITDKVIKTRYEIVKLPDIIE